MSVSVCKWTYVVCSGLCVVCPTKRVMGWGFSFQLLVVFGESRSLRVGSWVYLVSDTLLFIYVSCLP